MKNRTVEKYTTYGSMVVIHDSTGCCYSEVVANVFLFF